MTRLTEYDRSCPPYRPGDRVRLRAAADWAGPDAPPPPVHCVYAEAGGPERGVSWPPELAAIAGTEVELVGPVRPQFDRLGLPCVRVGPDAVFAVHPDWLAPPPDPAGGPCVCDDRHLFYRGCTCGRMARERAAR